MPMRVLLAGALALAACAPTEPVGPVLTAQLVGTTGERLIRGPGLACTEAFVVTLSSTDTLRWTDEMEDFIVYRLTTSAGSATLYAGNAPQPGGTELRTGRDFPAVVSITGADVADRVVVRGPAFARCSAK